MNYTRITAIIVALSLLNTSVPYSVFASADVPSLYTLPKTTAVPLSLNLSSLIPARLGQVTASRDFGGGAMVVAIQDLHSHAAVQRNIAGILEILCGRRDKPGLIPGLDCLFVEGGVGEIDTSWLDGMKSQPLRGEILVALLEGGRLTGSEYYAMMARGPGFLKGLEDEALHTESVKRYCSILDAQPAFDNTLSSLEDDLRLLEARYCGREAGALKNAKARRRAGRIDSAQYYRILERCLSASGGLKDYPNIIRYLKADAINRQLNAVRIGRELQVYVAELKHTLSYAEYRRLMAFTEDFSRVENLPVPRPDRYCRLRNYIAYRRLLVEINPMLLVEEEGKASRAAAAAVARTTVERDILFAGDCLNLLKDLLHARISADEYLYLTLNYGRFADIWRRYAPVDHLRNISGSLPLLHEYYRGNIVRNTVFARNLFGDAGPAKGVYVMVTGGFHTRGMQEYFEREKISYAILTPAVPTDTESADRQYKLIIRAQAESFSRAALLYRLMSNLAPVVEWRNDNELLIRFRTGEEVVLTREQGILRMRGIEAAAENPASWKRAPETGARSAMDTALSSFSALRTMMGPELVPGIYAAVAGMAYFAARRGWLAGDGLTADMEKLAETLGDRIDARLGMNPNAAALMPAAVQDMVADHVRRVMAAETSTPAAIKAVEGLFRCLISANSAIEYESSRDTRRFRAMHGSAPGRDRAVRGAGITVLGLINLLGARGIGKTLNLWFHDRWNLRYWGTSRQLMAGEEEEAQNYFATGNGRSSSEQLNELRSITGDASPVTYYRLSVAGNLYYTGDSSAVLNGLLDVVRACGSDFVSRRWKELTVLGLEAGARESPALFSAIAELRKATNEDFVESHWDDIVRLGAALSALEKMLGPELLVEKWDAAVGFAGSGASMKDLTFGVPAVVREFGAGFLRDHFDDILDMGRDDRNWSMISSGLPALKQMFGAEFVDRHWQELFAITKAPGNPAVLRCVYAFQVLRDAIIAPGDDRETLARLLAVSEALSSMDSLMPQNAAPLYANALGAVVPEIVVRGDIGETLRRLKTLFPDLALAAREASMDGQNLFGKGLPVFQALILTGDIRKTGRRLRTIWAAVAALEKAVAARSSWDNDEVKRLYERALPAALAAMGSEFLADHWDDIQPIAAASGSQADRLFETGIPGTVQALGMELLASWWPSIMAASYRAGQHAVDLLENDLPGLKKIFGDRLLNDPRFAESVAELHGAAGREARWVFRSIGILAEAYGADFVAAHWDLLTALGVKAGERNVFLFEKWLPAFKTIIVRGNDPESVAARLKEFAGLLTTVEDAGTIVNSELPALKEYAKTYAAQHWEDIPLLRAVGDGAGEELVREMIDCYCEPAGIRTIFRYYTGSQFRQDGYCLPFPVTDSAYISAKPYISLEVRQEPGRQEDPRFMSFYDDYQNRFLNANFAALELIGSSGNALTAAQAKQVLRYTWQMIETLDRYDRERARRYIRAYTALNEQLSALGLMRDSDILPGDMQKKVTALESRGEGGIRTVHTLINLVHAEGSDLLGRISAAGASIIDIRQGSRSMRVNNSGGGLLIRDGAIISRVLKAIVKARFGRNQDSGMGSITIMGNCFSWREQLGEHKVEFSGDLSDPDDGGFIKVRYFEPGAGDSEHGSAMRVDLIQKVLTRMGLTVQDPLGGVSLQAVISKDYGARSAAQLEDLLTRVVQLFDSIANLDLLLPALERSLAGSPAPLDLEKLAETAFAEGAVPPLGTAANDFQPYRRYRENATVRRSLIAALNRHLVSWGMKPIPAGLLPGQAVIDRYFTRPVAEALARGELRESGTGFPGRDPGYRPLHEAVASVIGDPEVAAQTARVVNSALQDSVVWEPTGFAGRLMAVTGQVEIDGGRYLVISGFKHSQNNQLLFASVSEGGRGVGRRPVDTAALVAILTANGYNVSLPERPAKQEIRSILKSLHGTIAHRSTGAMPVQGIPVSAGGGSSVVGKITFSRIVPDDGGRHIVVLPFTTPDDINTIRPADAVITTAGSTLSHAGITTRELGIPSIIVPGAVWRDSPDGLSLYVERYEPGEVEQDEGLWISRQVSRGGVAVHEGDIVLVNGRTGVLKCFAPQSCALLEKAYRIAGDILNGRGDPADAVEWIVRAGRAGTESRALADAVELMLSMALEDGYQPRRKGRTIIDALVRGSQPLPEAVRDRMVSCCREQVDQLVEDWTGRLEEAQSEAAAAASTDRLKLLRTELAAGLSDIEEASRSLGVEPAVFAFLNRSLESFQRKLGLKEQEIVEAMTKRARVLADIELTEDNLPELRRILNLAKRSGLTGTLRNVLLVGAGNYGRSAISEQMIGRMCRDAGLKEVTVVSRGLAVEPGRGEIARGAFNALLDNHIDTPVHAVRQLTSEDIAAADIVLTMDNGLAAAVGEIYPSAGGKVFSLTSYARTGLGDIQGTKKESGAMYGRMAGAIREAAEGVIKNIRLNPVFNRLEAAASNLEEQKRRRIGAEGRCLYALGEIDDDFVSRVGGKAAKLGEILKVVSRFGAYVPPGVAVGTDAFPRFLRESGIKDEFQTLVGRLDAGLAGAATAEEQSRIVAEYSRKLRDLIGSGRLSVESGLGKEIMRAVADRGMETMAVRSSAVQEDTDSSAFAGAAESYLYVSRDMLLSTIKSCFQSFYLLRGIQYRVERGKSQSNVNPAVLVQNMVDSSVAGVMQTVNPVNGSDEIVINASYGQGEAVVSNVVPGDHYTVSKETGEEIKPAIVGAKRVKIVRNDSGSGTETVAVDAALRNARCLTREQIRKLHAVGMALEAHFGYSLDIEFAFVDDRLAILQVRPVTALAGNAKASQPETAPAGRGGVMGWMMNRYIERQENRLARSGRAVSVDDLRVLRRQWEKDYSRRIAPWRENLASFAAGLLVSGLFFVPALFISGAANSVNIPAFLLAGYLLSWPLFLAAHMPALQPGRHTPRANLIAAGAISLAGMVSAFIPAFVPFFSSLPGSFAGVAAAELCMVLVHHIINAVAETGGGNDAGPIDRIKVRPRVAPADTRRSYESILASA